MREKEAKLASVQSSYQELANEFETHYEMIVKRDATIEQLRVQISSAIGEKEDAEARARMNTQLLSRSSDRLTTLEKRDEEVKAKIRDVKSEILKIQFETAKLAETKLTVEPEITEDELAELRERLADAEQRKNLTFQLVASINDESRAQVGRVQEQTESELNTTRAKHRDLGARRNELLAAIRGAERKMRDEIEQLDVARKEIEASFEAKTGKESEISELKAELRSIEAGLASLEAATAEERKQDEDRRAIVQTIKQKIDERSAVTEGDLAQARAILETQKKEIRKLQSSLEKQNEKLENMQAQIDEDEHNMSQKPDLEFMMEQDKQKLNQAFAKKARKQLKAQQTLESQQKQIDVQLTKQRRSIEQLAETINKCVNESKKRAEFAKKEKKKSKLVGIEIKQLEGELDGLEQKDNDTIDIPMPEVSQPVVKPNALVRPVPPPPPLKTVSKTRTSKPTVNLAEVEELTRQLDECNDQMEARQREMETLKNEQLAIEREIGYLTAENQNLRQELSGYDDLSAYFNQLKISAKSIPQSLSPSKKKPVVRK